MRGVEASSSEKPVMVLRYNRWRTAGFVFFFGICFVLSLFMFLIVTPESSDSIYEYWLTKVFVFIFTLAALWYVIDPLNTDRIEVYEDRIVKVRKFELPFFRSKSIKYEKAVFCKMYSGIHLADIKRRLFIFNRNLLILHTDILSKEDREKFAKFLSRISGWPENEFQSSYMVGRQKKLVKWVNHNQFCLQWLSDIFRHPGNKV